MLDISQKDSLTFWQSKRSTYFDELPYRSDLVRIQKSDDPRDNVFEKVGFFIRLRTTLRRACLLFGMGGHDPLRNEIRSNFWQGGRILASI